MAERPEKAPSADTPCDGCGEALGDEWGVKHYDFTAGIGNFASYLPMHSLCWWEANPKAKGRHDAIVAQVREGYGLKRELTKKELAAAQKRRIEAERAVS